MRVMGKLLSTCDRGLISVGQQREGVLNDVAFFQRRIGFSLFHCVVVSIPGAAGAGILLPEGNARASRKPTSADSRLVAWRRHGPQRVSETGQVRLFRL